MNQNLNDLLFKEGELARRKVNPHNFRWPELVFLAEAEREPFADVRVITLYSHCEELAYNKMLNELSSNQVSVLNIDFNKPQYRDRLRKLIPTFEVREFIEILTNEVVVAVDSDVVDDDAVDRALEMLETVEEFTVGTNFQFGSLKQYPCRKVDVACEIL